MVKRQLSDDEKRFCEKAIVQIEKRGKLIRPKVKYYDYMLTEGLRINYEEKYQEFLEIKKQINQELYTNDLKIVQLKDQITNGVEKIEMNKSHCKECGQEIQQEGQ